MNRSYLSEFINIILIGLVLFLFFTRGCGDGKNTVVLSDTVTSVSYIHDTIIHEIKVPVPVPVAYEVNEVPLNVDTAAILQAYYNGSVYEDTYSDTNIAIHLKESVAENKIQWREFKYEILRPTTVITNNITQVTTAKAKLFAGINLGGNKESFSAITPEIELIFYDRRAFSVGYNFQNKSVELGVKWRVGK